MGGVLMRLILVNAAVFLLLLFVDLGFLIALQDRMLAAVAFHTKVIPYLASSWVWQELLYKPWTVVTYMFTHERFWHAFWNLIILWFIGRMFQDLLGGRRLLGTYLLGGLTGLLLYILTYNFMPGLRGYAFGDQIVGASAAVMAVMLGIAVYRPGLLIHLPIIGSVKLIYVALVLLVLDLIGIRSGANSGGHIAHLGGALYGYWWAKGLPRGRDASLALVEWLERLGGVFQRRPGRGRMHVEHRGRKGSVTRMKVAGDKQARVDTILDKISRSGYDSLSQEEKDFLFKASNEG